MILFYLWLVITFQEENYINNFLKSAEQDRNNLDHKMPNEFIQGAALTAETCPASVVVRSALQLQYWIAAWKTERQRLKLARTISPSLTAPGQTVPNTAKVIPVLTETNINDQIDIQPISLRSLIKQGRYLVINFEYCKQLNSPIDFAIIYINEAHASDGLKFIGPQYSFIANHRDIQDRLNAVKILIEMAKINKENNQISVYSDTIDDHTNHLFRASPERLYVLHDQKVFYQGQSGPFGYSIPSLEYFLKNNILHQ